MLLLVLLLRRRIVDLHYSHCCVRCARGRLWRRRMMVVVMAMTMLEEAV